MTVRKVHFVETVPGFPIYEMENGDLRLPFPNPANKQMMWWRESDCMAALVKPKQEDIEAIKMIFKSVRDSIKSKMAVVN